MLALASLPLRRGPAAVPSLRILARTAASTSVTCSRALPLASASHGHGGGGGLGSGGGGAACVNAAGIRGARVGMRASANAAYSTSAVLRSGGGSGKAETKDGVVPTKVVSHPYITGNKRYLPGFSFPAPRRLESIIKYALLEREQPAQIKTIWNDFHAPRLDSVATTWSKEEYEGIAERKRRCPRFVYPVLKGDGKYFTLFAEWQDKFCIFTYLDDYRRNPAAAEPYLSVALYDDFLTRKGLVLVRGDFSGHLRKLDAAHIVNLMRYYYFQDPRLVESFNLTPGSFDFQAYLRDCPPPPTTPSEGAGVLKH
jgi:ATP synthase F1 complex assembly factor 1